MPLRRLLSDLLLWLLDLGALEELHPGCRSEHLPLLVGVSVALLLLSFTRQWLELVDDLGATSRNLTLLPWAHRQTGAQCRLGTWTLRVLPWPLPLL